MISLETVVVTWSRSWLLGHYMAATSLGGRILQGMGNARQEAATTSDICTYLLNKILIFPGKVK